MSEATPPVYVSDQVREVERLHRDLLTGGVRRLPIRDQLDRQAHRIAEGHKAGDRAVVTHITCWHPTLVCHSEDEIMNGPFTLEDARQTIARGYGFADWSDVESRGAAPPDPAFEFAVDTLLGGDVETLRGLLSGDPSLVRRRSGLPPYFGQPLEEVWADFRSEKPKSGVLPIGRDPGGNLIGIGYAGKRAGAVWWYDHETESFIRLAGSFTEFLGGLTKLPPGDWSPWLLVE